MRLQNKVALLTGIGQGMGRATALLFAQEGAKTALTARGSNNLEETADRIQKSGGTALVVPGDLSKKSEAENVVHEVIEKFGRIDILVNNGGVIEDSLLISMTSKAWDKVIDVNLGGVYNCTREATKIMIRKKKGKVINISSVVALSGGAGQANYAAAKAGIISFTRACAVEMGKRGIQFNTILPGMIITDMSDKVREMAGEEILKKIPAGRFGEASEIGDLVLFLASSCSDYINGSAIPIDGGLLTM